MAVDVSGVKYSTVNSIGFSPGDAPLGGVLIDLYKDNGDGIFDANVDVLVDQQQTAPGTGAYTFPGVADGHYYIQEQVPAGYIQSAGPAFYTIDIIGGAVYSATTLSIDEFSNPDPAATYFINGLNPDPYFRQDSGLDIVGGQRDLLVDVLGVSNPISANGFVGTIALNNGVFRLGTASSGPGSQVTMQYDGVDVDSAALVNALGMSVDLTANGNNGIRIDFNFLQVGSGTTMDFQILATSPGGGTASFNSLITQDPGAFSVFVPFASFSTAGAFTFADVSSLQFAFNQSGVQDVDFEIDQIVAAQQRNDGFDFGNFPLPGSLSGLKYADTNNNATHDPGEAPIGGVIITLTGVDDLGNAVNLQTQTLANGTYQFTNLRPGTYVITETPPINFIIGQPTIGSLGGTKTSNIVISDIVVPAAANGVNYNFGEIGLTPPFVSKRSLLFPPQPVVLSAVYTAAAKSADQVLVLGSDANSNEQSRVKTIDIATGDTIATFAPYGTSFHGGVRVAVADLNGDGYAEVITAPGAGRSGLVKVFNLIGEEIVSYRVNAYPASFKGGVFVAAADVNGDGRIDILTTPGAGRSAEVRAFKNRVGIASSNHDPIANNPLYSFLAFGSSFKGGATVAAGDLNGDGHAEIVVGNGPGMGPRVRIFDLVANAPSSGKAKLLSPASEILPMDPGDRGGVFVAVGNIHGTATPEIIVGNGAGGGGRVELFDAAGTLVNGFTAYGNGEGRHAPVHVAAKNVDPDALEEVITGQGSSSSSSGLLRSRNSDASLVDEVLQSEDEFRFGFFVA